jgi:hypothetical protein
MEKKLKLDKNQRLVQSQRPEGIKYHEHSPALIRNDMLVIISNFLKTNGHRAFVIVVMMLVNVLKYAFVLLGKQQKYLKYSKY